MPTSRIPRNPGGGCNVRRMSDGQPVMHGIASPRRSVDAGVHLPTVGTNTQHHNQEAGTARGLNSKGQPLLVPPECVLGQGPGHRTARRSFRRPRGRGLSRHVHPGYHDRALGQQRFWRGGRHHFHSRRPCPCHRDPPVSLNDRW